MPLRRDGGCSDDGFVLTGFLLIYLLTSHRTGRLVGEMGEKDCLVSCCWMRIALTGFSLRSASLDDLMDQTTSSGAGWQDTRSH